MEREPGQAHFKNHITSSIYWQFHHLIYSLKGPGVIANKLRLSYLLRSCCLPRGVSRVGGGQECRPRNSETERRRSPGRRNQITRSWAVAENNNRKNASKSRSSEYYSLGRQCVLASYLSLKFRRLGKNENNNIAR